MIRINIREAKLHLSRYLDLLARGKTIILCKRTVPVSEIRPLPRAHKQKAPIGLARGEFEVPSSFFQPLPAEFIKAFDGGA